MDFSRCPFSDCVSKDSILYCSAMMALGIIDLREARFKVQLAILRGPCQRAKGRKRKYED